VTFLGILEPVQKQYGRLMQYIDGGWQQSDSPDVLNVMNPALDETIAQVPMASPDEVNQAVKAAKDAFEAWRELPITARVAYIYRMKQVFDSHVEEISRITTQNHGKIIDESRGETRRLAENIETACSIAYTLAKGERLDQIATGIDETLIKEPLGVFSIIGPFNFPSLAPFWFIPTALVTGCTLVVKPSEITPLPLQWCFKILEEVGLPDGVVNLVHGSKDVSQKLISHRDVQGVCFVGSTPAARQVYALAGEHGKRALCQAGAKNYVVINEDADLARAIPMLMSSFFGNTGQRCLSGSNLVAVGKIYESLKTQFTDAASKLRLGYGLDESVGLGPVVSRNSKNRILGYVEKGIQEGADLVLDGRSPEVQEYPNGYFLGCSVFDKVSPDMTIAKEEIFGPVASLMRVDSVQESVNMINSSTNYGNAACIFTKNGKDAREFRRSVDAGNVGINIGIAAPMAFFPFGGRRDSFYGTLHGQIDCIDFFTDKKIVIERW